MKLPRDLSGDDFVVALRKCIACLPPRSVSMKGKMTLHAKILETNGKKQFTILPYAEFVALQERLDDLEDLASLRRAKRPEGKKRSIPLAEAKRALGLR